MINRTAALIAAVAMFAAGVASPSLAQHRQKSQTRAQATTQGQAAGAQRGQEQCWLPTDDHRGFGYMSNCNTPRASRVAPRATMNGPMNGPAYWPAYGRMR